MSPARRKKKATRKKAAPRKKPGAKPLWVEALVDELCAELAGGASLNSLCTSDRYPSQQSFFVALGKHPWMVEKYEKALRLRSERYAEEIVDIADEKSSHLDSARQRLRVDARKWVSSRLLPKKYGDRTHHEVTGEDGGPITFAELAQKAAGE